MQPIWGIVNRLINGYIRFSMDSLSEAIPGRTIKPGQECGAGGVGTRQFQIAGDLPGRLAGQAAVLAFVALGQGLSKRNRTTIPTPTLAARIRNARK
jgi:hypothetical protein